MRYYEIAGIVLKISGCDLHMQRLMSAYEISPRLHDVFINVSESNDIRKPENIKLVRSGSLRTYATTEQGYLTYDALKDGTLIALIDMDKAVTEVNVIARDIEHLGGANISVRKFNMLAEVFRYVVLVRKGVIFHCSALSVRGEAILFSAPSGTGKSTHTGLWCKYVPGTEVFNDDSPAIMIEGEDVVAYGTPWCGKSDVNKNVRLKVKAVVFLERGITNEIRLLGVKESFLHFADQSFRAPYTSLLGTVLDLQEKVLKKVPMYKLKCNISKDAVDTVFNELFEGESYES